VPAGLTGKYRRGAPLPPLAARQKCASRAGFHQRTQLAHRRRPGFAARRGRTLLALAVSWLLRDAVVASVIAGATTPEQVEQNVAAAGWTLSAEELAEIDRITM
jgi:aryl-alcohol dehydrogenase-like predicted oxidoreductase